MIVKLKNQIKNLIQLLFSYRRYVQILLFVDTKNLPIYNNIFPSRSLQMEVHNAYMHQEIGLVWFTVSTVSSTWFFE